MPVVGGFIAFHLALLLLISDMISQTLAKEFVHLTYVDPSGLAAYTVCHLILLDKDPGEFVP